MSNLSVLIKSVMAEKDWSQTKVAERSGLPLATVNAWIRGKRGTEGNGPKRELLVKLAAGLSLPEQVVFNAAGLHAPGAQAEPREMILLALFRELTPRDQRIIEATMLAMRS